MKLRFAVLLFAFSTAGAAPLSVAVFPFEAGPNVFPGLGDSLTDLVQLDLSDFNPIVAVPTAATHRFAPVPGFVSSDAAAEAGQAQAIGRKLGAAAVVTGRLVRRDHTISAVAKVVDAATGQVFGEMVQDSDATPVADLASALSQKIAALVLDNRGHPGSAWPAAGLSAAASPASSPLVTSFHLQVDGRSENGADTSLAPGFHALIARGLAGSESTRATFLLNALPGHRYAVRVQTDKAHHAELTVVDAGTGMPATTTVSARWVSGADRPVLPLGHYLLPGPFEGAAAVADQHGIYIVRGSSAPNLNQLFRFDLATHQLSVVARGLVRRSRPDAVAMGGKIYIMGGIPRVASRSVQIFDPLTGRISEGPRMPDARVAFGCAAVDDKIYVMGGTSFPPNSTSRVSVFDPAKALWTNGPAMPISAIGRCVTEGETILFFGGVRGEDPYIETKILAAVQTFDARTQTWSVRQLPYPWGGSQPALMDHRIFGFGSVGDATHGICYDLRSGRTDSFDLGERASTRNTAVSVGDRIYVIGGDLPGMSRGLGVIYEYAENPNWRADAPEGRPLANPVARSL